MALRGRLRGRRAAAGALGAGRRGGVGDGRGRGGAAGVYAAVAVRYRLGAGGWVWAAIVLVFLVSFTLAAATLLRRPRVALPGLLGGLLVALAWLAVSGFTFYGVIAPITAKWSPLE